MHICTQVYATDTHRESGIYILFIFAFSLAYSIILTPVFSLLLLLTLVCCTLWCDTYTLRLFSYMCDIVAVVLPFIYLVLFINTNPFCMLVYCKLISSPNPSPILRCSSSLFLTVTLSIPPSAIFLFSRERRWKDKDIEYKYELWPMYIQWITCFGFFLLFINSASRAPLRNSVRFLRLKWKINRNFCTNRKSKRKLNHRYMLLYDTDQINNRIQHLSKALSLR